MSDKEKKVIEKIAEEVSKMSENDKYYLLGAAEQLAAQAAKEEGEANE